MFILFLTQYFPTMASNNSELEMTPVPTVDEADGKAEEEEPTVENVIQTQVARFKQYQNSITQLLVWLRILLFCVIVIGIVFIAIHNVFAPKDKDVPDDVIKNLYKMLETQTGVNIGSITQQWPKVTNSSSG